MKFSFAQAAFAIAALSSTALASAVTPRATVCNGFSQFCSKSYGNITYVGAHDSYAVGSTNLAANQDYDVTQQLNDGIRMLQNQMHNQSDGLHLCHTSCFLFDGGTLVAYLQKVKTWMDANPNEVVSLLLVNSDNVAPTVVAAAFTAAGLDKYAYSPPSAAVTSTAWPTLGQLIDANTRVVTFMDTQASFASVPYLIDEFSNVWETAFDVTDQNWPCAVNRSGNGVTDGKMYLINHYLDATVTLLGGITSPAPAKDKLNVTNAVSGFGSLGQEVANCVTLHGAPPNFMLVDFYEYGAGSVFQVAAQLNGVTYNPSTAIAPIPTNTSTNSSGSTGQLGHNGSLSARGSVGSNLVACGLVAVSVLVGSLLIL
ncbi:hypothetical protein BOTBODRAFT_29906 [Botryobasidium botryosum FD-172 SS1]|uniref:PLC-like phosphodiesterase n=1 Tax=Botryobasidium botryosum (strain FD-172 SS1) TaxID=930990 RepID=A0A067N0S4_BOTB1|nr:hypothetical protein BOTBODRAFT_29906 [Botryobasidium botryosum FD-172 SS1]